MHIENLFFLLLLGVVAFFKWLAQRTEETRKNSGEQKPPPDETSHQAPPGSEEERVRRFLEALGQPSSSVPPPKVEQRIRAPRRATVSLPNVGPFGSPLPPLTTQPSAKAAPPPIVVVSPVPQQKARDERKAVASEASAFQVRPVQLPPSLESDAATPRTGPPSKIRAVTVPTATASLSELLVSPNGLRRAIILREIFGPPRGLQAFSEVGSV